MLKEENVKLKILFPSPIFRFLYAQYPENEVYWQCIPRKAHTCIRLRRLSHHASESVNPFGLCALEKPNSEKNEKKENAKASISQCQDDNPWSDCYEFCCAFSARPSVAPNLISIDSWVFNRQTSENWRLLLKANIAYSTLTKCINAPAREWFSYNILASRISSSHRSADNSISDSKRNNLNQ